MNLPMKPPKFPVSRVTMANILFGLSVSAVIIMLLDAKRSDLWFYLAMTFTGVSGLIRDCYTLSANIALLIGTSAYFITAVLSPIFSEFPYWTTVLIYAKVQVGVAIFARIAQEI